MNKEQLKATEFVYEEVPQEERERRIVELTPLKAKIGSNLSAYKMLSLFLEGLQKTFGKEATKNCELFHFAGGSLLGDGFNRMSLIFDFPGDDSIEKYLREHGA